MKVLGTRVLRELKLKLSREVLTKYKELFDRYEKAFNQERHSKDKVYSFHKPHTACIAKGKTDKKYEFGNKVGLISSSSSKNMIILAIEVFDGNPHDSKTIEPLLNQMENNMDYLPKELVYDRGGKGKRNIKGVEILTPRPPLKNDSEYEKLKKRKKFRRRAARTHHRTLKNRSQNAQELPEE